MNQPLIDELVLLHTFRRPAGSAVESAFINRFIAPLPGAWHDDNRNWRVTVGDSPTTLYSCHTDTVADRGGRQRVLLANGLLALAPRYHKGKPVTSGCLGADDTVGVFLCRQMILAGIPGHYVFHYGEERGCVGSRDFAEDRPDYLAQFTHAIAFDRKGYSDVITHQIGLRTCSDAFARALADALNLTPHLHYKPSDRGLFTDTLSYAHLIPECTNLSIGYADNHSAFETVDVRHVLRLLRALLTFTAPDWPIDRLPVDPHYNDTFADRYCRIDGREYERLDDESGCPTLTLTKGKGEPSCPALKP